MFHTARIKLTAWYLIIIMSISLSFSVVIYRVLASEVNRFATIQRSRIQRRLLDQGFIPPTVDPQNTASPIQFLDPDLVIETNHRVFLMLVIINGGIIVFAGGLGYLLAGRTLEPIQRMMDEQNRFISDASHELKTPLTSLKSAFEVYLRDKRPKAGDAHTLVRESVEEVNKLQSLSESLLSLAQYQKPNSSLPMEKISLTGVIEKALHRIEPMAKQKEIIIEKNIQNIEMKGNIYQLTDLLVILLDNAIKYSDNGSTVILTTKKTDGNVMINIKDHGIGVADGDLPHIFDRFYRADSARRKTNAGGYGLGLSIAKKIVDSHNGSIQVKSALGKGTVFSVRLPVSFS